MALRETWQNGYKARDCAADVVSGLTVCMIAIPMTMAVAIACGVSPEHGLYGAIIAGPLIGVLGGARLSITGPVAELAVLILPVVSQFGLTGLMVATWMAGLMLLIMGIGKLGRVIEFIPYPVTTGFIAGTGIVISMLQIKDFFGLTLPVSAAGSAHPPYFLERLMLLGEAFPTLQWGDTLIGVVTLVILLLWPRLKLPLPGHLAAMILSALLAFVLKTYHPEFIIETIGSRYAGGIPQAFPSFNPLWEAFDFDLIRNLFGHAFAIAMLCAIKALLCAVVLDGMSGTKHNPNGELIAQGIGNLVLPFFGGLTSTSALARSVANWRVGARSPLSNIVHGLSMLCVVLLFANIFSYLPIAGLSALLLIAAWNIIDFRHCIKIIRIGTRSDLAVLLICFGLTVLVDMVIAVGVGMVLAALLFMKQMANISGGRWLLEAHESDIKQVLPEGVMVYEISGPLFFGAAEKAMSTLRENSRGLRVVILYMQAVPTMDISGLVALRSALDSLSKEKILVILANVQEQPLSLMKKANMHLESEKIAICGSLAESIEFAKQSLAPAYSNFL
jgi:SulP family sulfate permease